MVRILFITIFVLPVLSGAAAGRFSVVAGSRVDDVADRFSAAAGRFDDDARFNNDTGRRAVSIMEIQGPGHMSPLAGDTVVTEGVVTTLSPVGFYLQDETGDQDPATSDGVFVFTGAASPVRVGDRVRVEGSVKEFRPGSRPDNLTVTEIDRPNLLILSGGNAMPAPVVIGSAGRPQPAEIIDDDGLTRYEPAIDGIDYYESLEGTLVTLPGAVVVGATNSRGESWVVVESGARATGFNLRGGLTVREGDFNPERIQIDGTLLPGGSPRAGVGDHLGDVTGVLGYSFGNFELLPAQLSPPVRKRLDPEITSLVAGPNHLTVASFNLRNLHPGSCGRFSELADIVVRHLRVPDILALQEIQDNSGPRNDGTVDAAETYRRLVDAIHSAGGPRYHYRDVAPEDGADAGERGGNIRVAILFNPSRVSFVDRGTPSATAATRVVNGRAGPELTLSPGRIEPGDAAWRNARKPLAAELRFAGQKLFVAVNHFSSRAFGTPLFGSVQPPVVAREARRNTQAAIVGRFAGEILGADPGARIVVLGDFNALHFENALQELERSSGLVNLARRLAEEDRYTLIFEGNSQMLDHIFVSPSLALDAGYDVVHVAAEFAGGASDHDPVVARLGFFHDGSVPASGAELLPAHPNPFRSETRLVYTTGGDSHVRLEIFNVEGRRIRTLVDAMRHGVGHVSWWDGLDDRGQRVVSGVYFARLRTGAGTASRKLTFVR